MKLQPRRDPAKPDGEAPSPVHMPWEAALMALASGAFDVVGAGEPAEVPLAPQKPVRSGKPKDCEL